MTDLTESLHRSAFPLSRKEARDSSGADVAQFSFPHFSPCLSLGRGQEGLSVNKLLEAADCLPGNADQNFHLKW